ncbi:competence protein [Staphylococcus caeli]|uniref:Competence protein n=1 Tax=Staphylococcus caeli TaxID=2201815 RepID=A0A1D4NQG6_9STAP|nr:competence protein [Staphylococcus caeli]SCT12831.1 competence protein [Staphylococcus caeli]
MVKQLQIKSAFTYLEMLLVLSIIVIILFIQLNLTPLYLIKSNSEQHQIKHLITQFEYLKSKAIKDQQSIALVFNDFSNKIIVNEQYLKNNPLILPQNSYILPHTNITMITFDKSGNVNKFGSLYIKLNETKYKIIFHIEKGRIRYEKV